MPPPAAAAKGHALTSVRNPTDGGFDQLDSGLIALSRFVNLVVFVVLGFVELVIGTMLIWSGQLPLILIALTTWCLTVAAAVVFVRWWPHWEYNSWSYRVGDQILELRYGVVWQVAVAIPLLRLQHVDLHRGPLERRWGLASLQVYTAGTRDASHRLPGLDITTAERVRDRLMLSVQRTASRPTGKPQYDN